MLKEKFIEIRDAATFIPALAFRIQHPMSEMDRWLMAKAGFGRTVLEQDKYIFLVKLTEPKIQFDVHAWGMHSRTMIIAHAALTGILEHWDEIRTEELKVRVRACQFDLIEPDAIIDVEYLLGLSDTVKSSERRTEYTF